MPTVENSRGLKNNSIFASWQVHFNALQLGLRTHLEKPQHYPIAVDDDSALKTHRLVTIQESGLLYTLLTEPTSIAA